jgi:hypothetical protein
MRRITCREYWGHDQEIQIIGQFLSQSGDFR